MNINISGEVVRTSQLPKRIIGLGDYLVALNSSPLETSTVLVSDFVSFLNTQFATSLASLTDVNINTPLIGQALVYNGSQWVNQGIGELDTLDSVTTRGNTTTNSITVGGLYSPYLRLDTVATPTLQAGMFAWNDVDGTANLRLKGNNVTLQIGQETVARVVNKTGADLLESQYKVVRVRVASEGGAQGQRLAVVLAQGDNDPDSATTLGVVTENIGNNQEGFITIFGNVNGINTTGSLQGETWVDGDVLYLSPTTPGGLTKVKPQAPQHTLIVGYVVYAHQNNGKIFVKVDNGYELDELHNVLISNPNNNDILQYNSTQQVWKNIAASVAVPTPTLAQVTTAGNTTTNAITVGGLTSTLANADVTHVGANAKGFYVRNNADSLVRAGLQFDGNTAFVELLGRYQNGATFIRQDGANGNISFLRAGSEYVRIFGATGNTAIGTTTDAGYKLDVNGTARVNGRITAGNASTAGEIYSNPSVGMTFGSGQTTNTFTFIQINSGRFQPAGSVEQAHLLMIVGQAESSNQENRGSVIRHTGTVSTSSGNAIFSNFQTNNVINTTGGTTIYRGFYHNPTLTSLTGTTHRAIETTSGDVIFGGGGPKLILQENVATINNASTLSILFGQSTTAGYATGIFSVATGEYNRGTLLLAASPNTSNDYNVQASDKNIQLYGTSTQFYKPIHLNNRNLFFVNDTQNSNTLSMYWSHAQTKVALFSSSLGSYGRGDFRIALLNTLDSTTVSTTHTRFMVTGDTYNVLIGTTTDNGYKLQVTGGGTFIKGSGSTSGTTSLLVQNSLGVQSGAVNDAGQWMIGTGTPAFQLDATNDIRARGSLYWGTAGSYLYGDANNIRLYDKNNSIILQAYPSGVISSETYLTSSSGNKFVRINDNAISLEWFNSNASNSAQKPINVLRGFFGNVLATDKTVLNITTPFFSNLTNATTLRGIFIDINDTTTYTGFTTVRAIEAPRGGAYFNTTTPQASAILQADSATQGFLPPRLTTAQILLIASPAEGLQVYNTDLKTICFYNGTAWQRVTSTAM